MMRQIATNTDPSTGRPSSTETVSDRDLARAS